MAKFDSTLKVYQTLATRIGAVLIGGFFVWGCQPSDSPLRDENERLREQVAKQDSVIISLQEGNKYQQQQVTLLTQDLREAKKELERLELERKMLTSKLEGALSENRKLALETQRLANKKSLAEQVLRVHDQDGQSDDLPQPLAVVSKATEDALSRNGYTLLATMKIDQKAVYVTERKSLPPASIEVPGFRNQYLISLHALAPSNTRVHVKADFERVAHGGRVLAVPAEEMADIARRLIGEITKAVAAPGKV